MGLKGSDLRPLLVQNIPAKGNKFTGVIQMFNYFVSNDGVKCMGTKLSGKSSLARSCKAKRLG